MLELLKRLEELETLSIEEAEVLATDIRAEYLKVKESDEGTVEDLKQLYEALTVVTARQETLATELEATLAEIAELDAKMGIVANAEGDAEGDKTDEGDADDKADDTEGDKTPEGDADVADTEGDKAPEAKIEDKELVGASQAAVKTTRIPTLSQKTKIETPVADNASSGFYDVDGKERSKEEFGGLVSKTISSLKRKTSVRDADVRHKVGSFALNDETVPTIGRFDDYVEANDAIAQVIAAKNAQIDNVASLKAAGGPCVVPRQEFGFAAIGGDCEPVGAFLPRVQSDAKSTSFYEDVDAFGTTLTNGVNIYTKAEDISGAEYPKGCAELACPNPVVCDKDIIEKCLKVGNWVNKAWPEYVDAMQGVLDTHLANVAEQYRLNKIWLKANSLNNYFVETTQSVGATDGMLDIILRYVSKDRAGLRDCSGARYNVILDEEVKQILTVDIARKFGFGSDRLNADSAVFELLRRENINIGFKKDRDAFGVANGTAGAAATSLVGTGAVLPKWDKLTRMAIFRDGSIVEEMGPELDLGIFRTQDDVENNNYSMFMEYWTSICFRNRHVFVVDAPICPNGAQSAAVTGTTCV